MLSRPYAALAIVCFVWGTTYLGIRIALETIPPFLMAAIRWIVAGGFLIAVFGARGEPLPRLREWPALTILGLLLIGVGNGAVVWAEQTVPSGLAAVLVAAVPFWMIGVEQFAPDADQLTARHVLGLAVGFSGIVLLVWPELRVEGGAALLAGVAATQAACLGWAVGSSWARRRKRAENVLVAAAFQMLLAGIGLLVFALLAGEWASLSVNGRTGGALAYLIVAGSLVGFSAYTYALKHLPTSTVSLYAYVNPIIAVLLGTLILDEPLSPRIAVASAVVLAGTMIVRRE